MSLSLFIFSGLALLLVGLLAWLLRDPVRSSAALDDLNSAEEFGQRHAGYFPQVRRTLAFEDFTFLASRASPRLVRDVRKERRRVTLVYLACLRGDFAQLWRAARMLAAMSPKLDAARELTRFRLVLAFYIRYELIRGKLALGLAPLPDLGSLSDLVSALAIRLETAMRELGERAALASELSSTLHRGGLDTL